MYQSFFFRLSQKKGTKKRVIVGQANLDLSDVTNLGEKCKLTSVYLIT